MHEVSPQAVSISAVHKKRPEIQYQPNLFPRIPFLSWLKEREQRSHVQRAYHWDLTVSPYQISFPDTPV